MTNSHNKVMAGNNNNNNNSKGQQGGTTTERYFNNTSPPYLNGGSGRKQSRTQRSPSTKCFNSKPTNNVLITPAKGRSDYQQAVNNYNGGSISKNNRTANGSRSPLGPSLSLGSSPPNFSHFAGSKCYDAPAPHALPKPPSHWTSCASEMNAMDKSKRLDIFSHNLKSILNVQA